MAEKPPISGSSRRIAICFVLQALSTGTLKYTKDVVAGLSERGARVIVDSLDSDYRLKEAEVSHILGVRVEWLGRRLPGRLMLELIRFCRVLPRLVREVASERIDVLYAQNMDQSALISCVAGVLTHRPVILFVHDLTDRELYVYERGYPRSLLPVLRSMARIRHSIVALFSPYIVAASRFVEGEIRPLARRPISIIPHGVNAASVRRRASDSYAPLRLLCVGKLEKKKRFEVPIEALSLLGDTGTTLTIVGSGPRKHLLGELAKRLGVDGRVRMTGFLEDEALRRVVGEADVGVVSSLWEGFGYAALEMMGYGLPVLASNAGALPEVVSDGLNGRIFQLDDFKQLAGILDRLSADRKELEALARGAAATASQYSMGRMVDSTYMKVCKVVQNHSSRSLRPRTT